MNKKGKYVYDWPRPMVTVDAIVFALTVDKTRILLIKRKNEPFKERWALPGGFVDIEEELEDAAARELAEETGLEGVALKQMHTFGRCGRDPRGRQITISFMGVVDGGRRRVSAGDDAAEARWFNVERLPKDLAFDHNEVVEFALARLKNRREYRASRAWRKRRNIRKG